MPPDSIADAVCVLAGGVVVQLGGRGEAGEHLELRLFELPRGAAGVGDVLDLGEELRDALRVVADRGERDARLDDAPAAVEVAPLKVLRPRGAAQQRGDGVPAGVTVLGMGELEKVRAAEFVGGVPEHVADGVVGALDRAVPTGDHAADRRLLERDPVQLRLPAQRLSSLPLLSGTFHAS